MKVILVSPGFPPSLGGVETHVSELAGGLADRGVSVEVLTYDLDAPVRSTELCGAVVVHRFPTSGSRRFPVSLGLRRYARRHLRDADLVHVQSYHATAALAALSVPSGIPVVFTPHFHGVGHTGLAAALHRPYRPLGRAIVRRANLVIAVSHAERELIVESFGNLASPIRTINNAANVAAIHDALPFPDEPPTVLVLGRLEPYKNVDDVAAAFSAQQARGQLVVIGEGSDRARLEARAGTRRRSEDIRFLGRVPERDLHRWLRTARAVVSMSGHEAFGLVAVEGVAAGAVALLSGLPAHREVSTLLPAGRTHILSDTASLPAELARALSQPNGGPVAVRSWADVAAEHLQLYRALLGGGLPN